MTPVDLALLLQRGIKDSRHSSPDPVNVEALAGAIGRWIREDGLPRELVHAMVEEFVHDPRRWAFEGAPAPWRGFLADRQDLLVRAEKRLQSESGKSGWDPDDARELAASLEDNDVETFAEMRERLIRGDDDEGVE